MYDIREIKKEIQGPLNAQIIDVTVNSNWTITQTIEIFDAELYGFPKTIEFVLTPIKKA